jgi:DNA repair protein RadC
VKGLGDASAALFPAAENDKPGYIGHRQRLRDRFLQAGPDGLQEYELLELLLFGAIPRSDTKPLAKALIHAFGSFGEVISAPAEDLRRIDGVGDSVLATLKAVQAGAQLLLRTKVSEKPVISSWSALLDYCTAKMAYGATEQFRLIYLDRKNRLIEDEAQGEGTVDHTPVYPREVVKRALELKASALIMVHNHPSGDPKPSRADIEMTRKVKEAAAAVGLTLHDHVIVSRGGALSFRTEGLL